MDEFDAMCLEHDWCYHEADDLCCWSVFLTSYKYHFGENNVPHCGKKDGYNPNNKCQEFLCQCDIKFANSMRQLIENPNGAHNCPKRSPGCSNGLK